MLGDYLTFDIMSNIIFSADNDSLSKNDFRWVPKAISESNVRISVMVQTTLIKLWRLDKRLFPEAIKARNQFVRFVSQTLHNRLLMLKSGREVQDIFSFLTKAKDPEGEDALTTTELGAESATLIVAGEKDLTFRVDLRDQGTTNTV